MNTSLPAIARLNPPPAAPEGMAALDSPIRNGLPHAVALLPRWRVLLVLPLGVAATLRDLPPGTLLSSDAGEAAPAPAAEAAPDPARPAPRLRVQQDGETVATLPLAAGLLAELPGRDGGFGLRLFLRGWALHAGTLLGPGDFGSVLRLAAARADLAADSYEPVPPSPALIARLPPADRMESRAGLRAVLRLRRIHLLKQGLR
ncbi:hypothetical protein [Roseomonas sp. BN140053]|uniref:hypothetical protein n=1 Tax=Roseomonas sp. BN140053 TaxID=3391898 RepID=UPI0039E86341